MTWTGPNDYYLQIASINLPQDERYSGSLAGTGVSAEWRDKTIKFRAPPLTEEEAKLKQLIDQGFAVLRDNKTTTGFDKPEADACEIWLDAWEIIKELYQIPVDRELEDADHARERLDQLLALTQTATLEA